MGLREAQQYLARGWSIIPLQPRSKIPAVKSWTGYQNRRMSSSEANDIFKDETLNIGIITGSISNLVVVDADGPEGLASLQTLSLSSPVTALTGKGKHLYFSNTTERTSNAVRIRPGIDIRGEGGFVCAPNSVHENGRRYRWSTNFVNAANLPEFPKGLLTVAPVSSNTRNEESWIAKALQEMKHGNIDDTLVSVLGRLRHDGYSRDDARALLCLPAEQAGAQEGHLDEKIENVWSRYEAKKSVTMVENEEAESIGSLLEDESEPEWVVPGLVANNSIGFCVGLPESNKTWIMMDLAISAATGGDWLGLFPVTRTKTLFIDQERWRGEGRRRFKLLLQSKGLRATDMDNLLFKSGSTIKIDLENSYSAFERLLEKVQPKLVIIDSLATFHTREENSRSEIQSIMEKMKALRDKFNCTFLFISHSNKFAFQAAKDGTEPDMGLMAGSIALPAAAETVLMVQKAKGGGSTVFHVKSTLAQKKEPFGVMIEDVPHGIVVRGVK